jgi:hydroxymethylpyrimidine pyrophosphatase-like HAD family hydrolase
MRRLQADLEARLAGRGAVEVGLYPPDPCWVLTVTAAGCNKAVGLAEYAARLGVAPAQVMAIGDSHNDLGMLRWAGLAVAMGNAAPEVRAVADQVVADHDHDGVAEALRRFVPAAATEAR